MPEMLLPTCLNAELLYQQRKAAFSSLVVQLNRLLNLGKRSQDNVNSNTHFTNTFTHKFVLSNYSSTLHKLGD